MPPQRDLNIGSVSLEDWGQRLARIWNMRLMETAREMNSDLTTQARQRVKIIFRYLDDVNTDYCPMTETDWPAVDMMWGKPSRNSVPGSENGQSRRRLNSPGIHLPFKFQPFVPGSFP